MPGSAERSRFTQPARISVPDPRLSLFMLAGIPQMQSRTACMVVVFLDGPEGRMRGNGWLWAFQAVRVMFEG